MDERVRRERRNIIDFTKDVVRHIEEQRQREERAIARAQADAAANATKEAAEIIAEFQATPKAPGIVNRPPRNYIPPLLGVTYRQDDVEGTMGRKTPILVWRDLSYPLERTDLYERHQNSIGGVKDTLVEFRGTKEGAVITEGFTQVFGQIYGGQFSDAGSVSVGIITLPVPTTGKLMRVQLSTQVPITQPVNACVIVTQRAPVPGGVAPLTALSTFSAEVVYASDSLFSPTISLLSPATYPINAWDRTFKGIHYQNRDDALPQYPTLFAVSNPYQKHPYLYVVIVLDTLSASLPSPFILNVKLVVQEIV
jgi:hypothetical protein